MAHIRCGFCQRFLLGDDVEADGLIVGKPRTYQATPYL
ncbi:hypothetical protein C4K24_0609 [Pseudomonas chlororaphis subsp. aurantiaca]|nr:hypothetical protein C4K24_0609 [Pseudomonas chlororaphis subsp. aurantiaca]AZD52484.1 hypothetical protein C4K19_0670 [Pseudomonas chlororaphis subsp. aurantiaca]AZD58613.1 hypothetical protein C4K18_0613 [Pseudomonas chlororaphis subsp. aurantiaca]